MKKKPSKNLNKEERKHWINRKYWWKIENHRENRSKNILDLHPIPFRVWKDSKKFKQLNKHLFVIILYYLILQLMSEFKKPQGEFQIGFTQQKRIKTGVTSRCRRRRRKNKEQEI